MYTQIKCHTQLALLIILLKLCGILNLGMGWIILIALLFTVPGFPMRTIAFIIFKCVGLLTFNFPLSWWWILVPIAIDIVSLISFWGYGILLEIVVNATTFALLIGCGVISISWWWIILAIILFQIPCAKSILFVIFKLCGLFAMPVSWKFIFLPLIIDMQFFTELFGPKQE